MPPNSSRFIFCASGSGSPGSRGGSIGIEVTGHWSSNKNNGCGQNQRSSADHSPLMLPLAEYAGTYAHAGYKDVTMYLDSEGVLRADRKDMAWPETIRFQHVTGEHFLMLSTHYEDLGPFCPEVYDAEFRISIEGNPCTLGVAWERVLGGEKI